MTARPTGRPAGRPRRDDSGISLAELVVTIGLMALIGTMVASVSIVVMRTYLGVQARNENSTQAELGVAATGKVLRTAILPEQLEDVTCVGCASTAIIQAGPKAVTFYANLGSSIGPSKVSLLVIDDPRRPGTAQLLQQTEAPTSTSGTSYTFCDRSRPSSCRIANHVLARGLVRTTPAVFTYYDYEGRTIAESSVGANLSKVSSVDVIVTVQAKPGDDAPPRTSLTRVRLPNVEIVQPESTT